MCKVSAGAADEAPLSFINLRTFRGGPDFRQPPCPPRQTLSFLRYSWHLSVPLIYITFGEFVLDILDIPNKELSRATDGKTAECPKAGQRVLFRS